MSGMMSEPANQEIATLAATASELRVTLSKLNFLDPEITEFNNSLGFGVGANSGRAYPMPIFTGFGIDITFL